jgi:TetR/AcrR family transcriptional repressor of bet genes
MTRPTNTKERREQIARALGRVMAEQGYEGASMKAVAREAGLAPGLCHYHFASKEEILLELVDMLAADASARADRAAARASGDPRAELVALIDSRLALGAEADASAVAAWVAVAAEAIRRPAVREAYERALAAELDRVEACARRALVAARGSSRGARALAAAVVAATQGYFVLGTVAPGAVPRATAAPQVRALVEALLAGDARPARRASR